MFKGDIMDRPLIWYGAAIFMGSLSSLVLFNNKIIGAAFAASFLSAIYFTKEKKEFIIVLLFFILGIISFANYFNIKVTDTATIRITDQKYYYYMGNYKGRKIIIKGNVKGLYKGCKIDAKGIYKSDADYKRGIIGTYNIESYKLKNQDFISFLYKIKKNMYLNFSSRLGEEKSALLMALSFGDTSYLINSQKDEFNKLGVIHAISVSGFHMALIYGVMEKALGMKVSLLAAFLYGVFTGMGAATMRAFFMIFILKLSGCFFKKYDGISSLSLAAMILLIINPWYIGDIGFMLSFLSTLGIILYYKKFTNFLYRLPEKISEGISISLSAQIFSMPFVAFTLSQFSPGFLLGNLVLLPIYSILVLLGNLAMMLSFSPLLFNFIAKILSIALTALEGANHILLKFCPEITYFSWLNGGALLLIYLSFIYYKKGYKEAAYYPGLLILFLAISSYSIFPKIHYKKLQEGTAILIKYKGQSVLICSYKSSKPIDIYKLKDEFMVNKVLSNPEKPSIINISDMVAKVYPVESNEKYNNMEIVFKDGLYPIKNKYVGEYSDLYVIILNRLFRLSGGVEIE